MGIKLPIMVIQVSNWKRLIVPSGIGKIMQIQIARPVGDVRVAVDWHYL